MVFFWLLLLALAVLLLLWGFAWLLYKAGGGRRRRPLSLILPGAALAVLGYFVFTAFYPNDEFYEEQYQRLTGQPFPEAGLIVAKDASFPDQHGDYAACARLEVSAATYEQLLARISRDSAFSAVIFGSDSTFISSESFQKVAGPVPDAHYARCFSGGNVVSNAYRFIGFLADRRTLIIYRCSS